MHLFLVRHGQCQAQVDHTLGPDSALTALGRREAAQAAEALAECRLTHLLSSPLVRSLETAQIIAERLGDRAIEVWTELRENYPQTHRGFGRAELLRHFPRAVIPGAIGDDGWDHGGDTATTASARGHEIVRLLQQRFGSTDRVAVVAHGGCLNHLLHALLGLPPVAPCWFQLHNGAISSLRLIPEPERQPNPIYPLVGIEVWSLNDRRHLDPT